METSYVLYKDGSEKEFALRFDIFLKLHYKSLLEDPNYFDCCAEPSRKYRIYERGYWIYKYESMEEGGKWCEKCGKPKRFCKC